MLFQVSLRCAMYLVHPNASDCHFCLGESGESRHVAVVAQAAQDTVCSWISVDLVSALLRELHLPLLLLLLLLTAGFALPSWPSLAFPAFIGVRSQFVSIGSRQRGTIVAFSSLA